MNDRVTMEMVRAAMEAAQGGPPVDLGVRIVDGDMLDLTSGPGWIYFIVPASAVQVKIGWALQPLDRLKTLQTGHPSPLRIVALIPGTQDQEYLLHRVFAEHRIRGEWFSWRDLRPKVEALAKAKGYLVNRAKKYRKSRNSPERKSTATLLRVFIYT